MIVKTLLLLATAILGIYYYRTKGPVRTYNEFIIPVFLLFPVFIYLEVFPWLPFLTFCMAAYLPVMFLILYQYHAPFTFGVFDVLVFFLAIWAGVAATLSTSSQYGIMTLFDKLTGGILPYFLVRIIAGRVGALRVLVSMAFVITALAVIAPLEAFFNINPLQWFQKIWPDWFMWSSFVRGGLNRVYSTFGHPIHAGMMFSIGVFVGFLTWRMKVFRTNRIPFALMLINGFAIWTTVSRSSYFLTPIVLLIINFAFVRRKAMYATILILLATLVLLVALPAYNSYVNVSDPNKADETQTSAAYRAVLLENYYGKIMESPWIGYGFHMPVVDRQTSIDNYYLYLALRYGVPGFLLFSLLLSVVLFRCLFAYDGLENPKDKVLLWAVFSMLVYFAIMCGSVWLTGQVRDLLYILFGLAMNFVEPRHQPKELWVRRMRWI